MLFKRSFGLTRSLFILYIYEHDRLGFWLYLIAFVDFNSSNCDRKGQSFPVEYYLALVVEFSGGINQAGGNT